MITLLVATEKDAQRRKSCRDCGKKVKEGELVLFMKLSGGNVPYHLVHHYIHEACLQKELTRTHDVLSTAYGELVESVA